MCGAGIEEHYLNTIDFEDLEEEVRMQYILEATEELYAQGEIPYGIMTGDDDTVDNYEPVLRLARLNYESSFE